MQDYIHRLNRRTFVKLGGLAAAGYSFSSHAEAQKDVLTTIPLFDGKTLDGWIQIENGATSLSPGSIIDQTAFLAKLTNGVDPVSRFLQSRLEDLVKADLAAYSVTNPNAKALMSAFLKDLNQVIHGPSIYDVTRFSNVMLRPETEQLLQQEIHGLQLARLNMLLLEDAYPQDLAKSTTRGWEVKNGVIASSGTGRGVMYTANDYERYRLIFTMRHVSGKPDHPACVLVFCTRPRADEMPLDALGGIQFDVPSGGHWDYRPGMNRDGGAEYTAVANRSFDVHAWSQIELLVDATKGTARMAVAQPPGSKAVETLSFNNLAAGRVGPIALQMHNAGLFDEYKDIIIEVDPKEYKLLTTE
jgi:Domain of Unknown Function (DUF1080)